MSRASSWADEVDPRWEDGAVTATLASSEGSASQPSTPSSASKGHPSSSSCRADDGRTKPRRSRPSPPRVASPQSSLPPPSVSHSPPSSSGQSCVLAPVPAATVGPATTAAPLPARLNGMSERAWQSQQAALKRVTARASRGNVVFAPAGPQTAPGSPGGNSGRSEVPEDTLEEPAHYWRQLRAVREELDSLERSEALPRSPRYPVAF